MNNPATKTGKTFNLGGLVIEQVRIEPCYRFTCIAKGIPIVCACTSCKARKAA